MGFFQWLTTPIQKNCRFCGLGNGDLQYVISYFSYSTKHYFFHESCLKKVLGQPEQYGHRAVDVALDIEQCITQQRKDEANRRSRAHEAFNRLEKGA